MRNQLISIIALFYREAPLHTPHDLNRALYVIMANSTVAVNLISAIEDEFNIEIQDEDVSLDNFLDFDQVLSLIAGYREESAPGLQGDRTGRQDTSL